MHDSNNCQLMWKIASVYIQIISSIFFKIGFSQYNMTHYLNLSNLSVEKNRLFFFGFHNLP